MATIKEVKDLVQQKVEVERELDDLHSVLESVSNSSIPLDCSGVF